MRANKEDGVWVAQHYMPLGVATQSMYYWYVYTCCVVGCCEASNCVWWDAYIFKRRKMLWKELEDRVYKIIRNSDITDREKAELILIEFNQYPGSGSGGHRRTTRGRLPRYVNNHFMLGEGVSQKTLRVGRKEGIIMSKTKRGKQDGTGPYKDSYQRKTSKVGKRVQAGKPCPKKK